MDFKHLFAIARKAVGACSDDYAPSMGAAISYYTVFSLAPLLVIIIAVAGFLFGREAVQDQVVGQISGLIGRDGAIAVQGLIASASEPRTGVIATAISLAAMVVGATTVLGELQSALDRIWHVPESQKASGIRAQFRTRLFSFGLILGFAFLMMVSLVASTAISAVGAYASALLPGWELMLHAINTAVSLCIGTLLFAAIFKWMPQTRIDWRDVWIGAGVTAVLFEAGKVLIGLYLGKSGVASSFAAAGSLVVILVWVYYAAQIFLLGAEFTKVYAQEHGSRKHRPKGAAPQTPPAGAPDADPALDPPPERTTESAPQRPAAGSRRTIPRRAPVAAAHAVPDDRAAALKQALLLAGLQALPFLVRAWRSRRAPRSRARRRDA
jgi:membrane protein